MVGLRFGPGQRGVAHLAGGRQAAYQTGGQQAAAAQGQLVFLVSAGGQQAAQSGKLGLGSGHGVHVDDDRRDVAQFVGHGFFQAPEQALRGDGLIRSAGGLCLAGQHGQAHGGAVLLYRQSLGQMQEGLGRMVLEGSFAAAAQEVGLVAVQAPEEHDAPGRAALPRSWSRAASPAERPAAMPAAYGQTFRQERTFLFCLFFFPGARSVPDMPPAICNRRSASRISSLCRVNAPRMP